MTDITRSNNLSHSSELAPNTRPHDSSFDQFGQVHITIPHSVFERAGLEMSSENLKKIWEKVLKPMPRFYNFTLCSASVTKTIVPRGREKKLVGKIIVEKGHTFGDVGCFGLPEEFVLPPTFNHLPPSPPKLNP